MTKIERTRQLNRRKTIATGVTMLLMAGVFFSACLQAPCSVDVETDDNTDDIPTVAEIEKADVACVEIDWVETAMVFDTQSTEEPTEVVVETETEEIAPKRKYTQDDLKRLARLIYFEDSQCTESMKWCGSVVLNRVESKRFPNNIKDVIHEKGQFSVSQYYMSRKVDKKLYAKCEAVAKSLLENGSAIPKEVVGMAHYGTFKKYSKKLYKRFGKVYYFSVR